MCACVCVFVMCLPFRRLCAHACVLCVCRFFWGMLLYESLWCGLGVRELLRELSPLFLQKREAPRWMMEAADAGTGWGLLVGGLSAHAGVFVLTSILVSWQVSCDVRARLCE